MRQSSIFICALALVLFACAPQQEEEMEALVRPVKIEQVAEGSITQFLSLPAVVEAAEESVMTFQVGGLLNVMEVIEGDEVAQGALLARLDQRDFRNAVLSAQAEFDRADSEYARARTLIERDAISVAVLEQRRAQREAARATLDSAQKQLEDSSLTAPFSGIVADIHIETFESIAPQQPILTLQSDGLYDAVVQVPASVVIGYEQMELLEISFRPDGAPDLAIPGVMTEAASLSDPATQTFEVRFAFQSPESVTILPGMTGLVHVDYISTADPNEGMLSVPVGAVVSGTGDPFVWLVDTETMTVSRQEVVLETGNDGALLVAAGLNPGDTIVVAGGHYLSDGARVRPFER